MRQLIAVAMFAVPAMVALSGAAPGTELGCLRHELFRCLANLL